ncbi:unnamed protein product [Discosporangium mesarthrocarpum]
MSATASEPADGTSSEATGVVDAATTIQGLVCDRSRSPSTLPLPPMPIHGPSPTAFCSSAKSVPLSKNTSAKLSGSSDMGKDNTTTHDTLQTLSSDYTSDSPSKETGKLSPIGITTTTAFVTTGTSEASNVSEQKRAPDAGENRAIVEGNIVGDSKVASTDESSRVVIATSTIHKDGKPDRRRSLTISEGKVEIKDRRGAAATFAVKLHDHTRVGDEYQATSIPDLRELTAESMEQDMRGGKKEVFITWDSSRTPDDSKLQLLLKRLRIGQRGSSKDTCALTHADVVTALHKNDYQLARAEAWLSCLRSKRETKIMGDSKEMKESKSSRSKWIAPGAGPGGAAGLGGRRQIGGGDGGGKVCPADGERCNRIEDWSEEEKAYFLKTLGEKASE